MRPTRAVLAALASAAALCACGGGDAASPTVTGESAPLAGTFFVTSRFSVPATVAAPGPLGDALRLVHGLAEDPGTALLDLAGDAGVPAVEELRWALPDAVEAELAAWMNAYLRTATVDGVSPHARIAELDALVRSVLLEWELRSTLALPDGAPGRHEPVALAFDSPAGPVVIPVAATAPVTAGVGFTASVSWPEGPGGAAVAAIGDHAMGVPFGRYALEALDAILLARTGAPDVRAYLAAAVGCEALAASVADECLGPVCVGHEAELLAVCDGGLAEAAARLEARVLGLDFRAIHLAAGTATAAGASRSPARGATALQDGVWTATIDLAQGGTEAATATFSAIR